MQQRAQRQGQVCHEEAQTQSHVRGYHMVCAIHNNSTGKQVAQLSSTVQPECSSIVGQMVLDLNESKRTLEDVIGELNTLKGSS